jgi:triosephosphate isomerase
MELRIPLLLVGFKTYLQATGDAAVKLARITEEVSDETGIDIVVIPQLTDVCRIRRETEVPVFAQHIDPIEPGSHTGSVLPEAVRDAGAVGTLINHSERKLPLERAAACIRRAREAGLISCVCSDSTGLSGRVAAYGPELILVENPELIGSGRAVSSADPEIIAGTVRQVGAIDPEIRVVCGAGISSSDDVAAALNLGAVGVGAASAIVKAADPRRALNDLAEALESNWTGERAPIG